MWSHPKDWEPLQLVEDTWAVEQAVVPARSFGHSLHGAAVQKVGKPMGSAPYLLWRLLISGRVLRRSLHGCLSVR
jgi:hypothetical protein